MSEETCKLCGGCPLRQMAEQEYRAFKVKDFSKTIAQIKNADPIIDDPIFIQDGNRRRADVKFRFQKHKLILGFNEGESHNIVNVEQCPMLTTKLNDFLPQLRTFLEEFCQITYTVKNKKKLETKSVRQGSVKILEADNGIDIMLSITETPGLEHRLAVADFVNATSEIVRLSWAVNNGKPETIVEKSKPLLYIADCVIEIPQGVFLQASKTAENLMINKVLEYLENTKGKVADLFCGLGTFTYPLAKQNSDEVISVDSFAPSLEGLQKALNQNQIHNVRVLNRNLFKYPLDSNELKGVRIIVLDPPRAGAHEQCRMIAELSEKPEKIIFVSCNPKTFVFDSDLLVSSGYKLEHITMVDQFVYSKHQELIALFTYNSITH